MQRRHGADGHRGDVAARAASGTHRAHRRRHCSVHLVPQTTSGLALVVSGPHARGVGGAAQYLTGPSQQSIQNRLGGVGVCHRLVHRLDPLGWRRRSFPPGNPAQQVRDALLSEQREDSITVSLLAVGCFHRRIGAAGVAASWRRICGSKRPGGNRRLIGPPLCVQSALLCPSLLTLPFGEELVGGPRPLTVLLRRNHMEAGLRKRDGRSGRADRGAQANGEGATEHRIKGYEQNEFQNQVARPRNATAHRFASYQRP